MSDDDMMCCPLEGGDGDWDIPIWNKTIRAARKQHKCIECGDVISPRQKYEYVSTLTEGDWYVYKTCLPCVAVRDHFDCGNGSIIGEIWTGISANFFPSMSAGGKCIEGMRWEGKEKLFDKYNDWLPHGIEEREWWQNQDELAHQAREWIEKQGAQT